MQRAFIVYLLILFGMVSVTPFLDAKQATSYLSVAILACGLIAIVFQKTIHRQPFVDMGFRLNYNAVVGMVIGLIFTVLVYLLFVGGPCLLGWARLMPLAPAAANPLPGCLLVLLVGGAILFISCLFGEELAFRGYVLPKLVERLGFYRGILWCALIFAVWHLPAYFSVYKGGGATGGWRPLTEALLTHGLSVIPVCLLYLSTRELYGVSLYHALADVIQYSLIRNPTFGQAAQDAVYELQIIHPARMEIVGWAGQFLAIPMMWILCRLARRLIK